MKINTVDDLIKDIENGVDENCDCTYSKEVILDKLNRLKANMEADTRLDIEKAEDYLNDAAKKFSW